MCFKGLKDAKPLTTPLSLRVSFNPRNFKLKNRTIRSMCRMESLIKFEYYRALCIQVRGYEKGQREILECWTGHGAFTVNAQSGMDRAGQCCGGGLQVRGIRISLTLCHTRTREGREDKI